MNRKSKSEVLGEPHGAASARLRKALLFAMAAALGRLACYRCGRQIESIEEFSIDHAEPWQAADDPKAAFFDLENVAFSHLACNSGAARRPNKRFGSRLEQQRAVNRRYYERKGQLVLERRRVARAKLQDLP